MPVFDFRCTACGHVFESTVAMGAAGTPPCRECGKPTEKLLSAPGVVFKGSGFYKTDSRAAPEKATKKSEPPKPEKKEAPKKDS